MREKKGKEIYFMKPYRNSEKISNRKEIILLGDFKAWTGKNRADKTNERGVQLIEFCGQHS